MNFDGKVVRFNFFCKIISARQAQFQNVFSYYQLPGQVHDFCTIQMNKEPRVFNSLCWKNVLRLECHVPLKQTSSYIVEISRAAMLCYTDLRIYSFSPWHHTPQQYALCGASKSCMADFDSPSPWQVLEESSTVLSQFTYEWPQSGLLLFIL